VLRFLLAATLLLCGAVSIAGCGGGDDGTSSRDRTKTAERREEREETREARAETREAEDETPAPERSGRRSPTPAAREGELPYDELIELTLADLEEYWSANVPEIYGMPFTPLAAIGPYFVSTGEIPSCGGEEADPSFALGNAFYCPPDDYIAWDEETLFPQIFTDHGDFAVALVLSHEYGHAIQARGGADGPDILLELQADCFAGAWTAYVDGELSNNLTLSPGDLDEGIAGYLQFRDAPGTSAGSIGAHGSGFDRVNAFAEGFRQGPQRCANYVLDPPLVVPLQFTSQEEFESGGDLPYDDVAPLITTDLEDFWADVMPLLYGIDWTPVSAFGPYDPQDEDRLPPCGDLDLDEDFYEANAFYCPVDDFIAWDDAVLFPELYDDFGDFAPALVLAMQWGHAVQQRAGVSGTTFQTTQQADCFAGAWVASIILKQSDNLTLSPGDLDEAIQGFLVFRDAPDVEQDPADTRGTAFERVSAFQNGVINGAQACLSYVQ
jgi:predicted metalloprotease